MELIVLKFTERTYEEKEGIGVKEGLLKSRVKAGMNINDTKSQIME